MTTRNWLGAVSLLAVMSVSCQPPPEDSSALNDEAASAVRAKAEAFMVAVQGSDFSAAAETMSEDVIIMVPNQESLVGRTAWRDWVSSMNITVTDYQLGIDDIEARGDLAFVRGTFSEILAVEGMEEPIVGNGKYLQIWRKQPDGSWLVAVDCWNSSLPLPEMEG